MVTIHDVAKAAGVSIATVSHVINHTKNVSPATAQKVNAALEELNYVPNIAAKSLKANNYQTIGVITEEITAFSTSPIIDAITYFLDQKGYIVNLCNLSTYHNPNHMHMLESSLHLMESSRAQGLIYIGANSSNVSHIRSMIRLPIVFAYSQSLPTDYCINYDNFNAARQAALLFISKGHTRMGVITGSMAQTFVQQRLMGFQSAMVESGLVLSPEFIRAGDWNYDLAYQHALTMLSAPEPPTAIFAMNDPMACAVIAAARSKGLRVPEDLSVIGFDNRSCSAYISPAITTLRIPCYEIGTASASALLNLLDGQTPPHCQELTCELVERASVAPPPSLTLKG